MPNVKISALPNVTSSSYTDSDLFVLVNYTLPSGTTSNTTLSALTEYIWSGYTGTTSGNCISNLCVSGPIKSTKDVEVNQIAIGKGGSEVASNTGVGKRMLENNTTGSENTAMGEDVLYSNTTGSRNSALGKYALKGNTTGSDNIAIGSETLLVNDSDNNVAIGSYSLNLNTTAMWNVAIGTNSLSTNSVGEGNVAIGLSSLFSNVNGDYNVSIGYSSGNVNTTGNFNTFIGANSNSSVNNLSYVTAIGANTVVSQSNSIVLGVTENVGINEPAPTSTLHITGINGYNQLRLTTQYTPTGTGDTNGDIGDVAWDDSHFYMKTNVGWGRIPLDYLF